MKETREQIRQRAIWFGAAFGFFLSYKRLEGNGSSAIEAIACSEAPSSIQSLSL